MNDGVCIHTYFHHRFDPTVSEPSDLCIEDIAHALSLICRANGHLRHFYSVAQHCLACRAEAAARGWSPRLQLLCLLHDASEAYIGDLTRPLKRHLPLFSETEDRLQAQMFTAFGIPAPTAEEAAQVSEIDDAMLYWEFQLLHPYGIDCKPAELTGSFAPQELPPAQVEADYLAAFHALKEAL